MKTSVKTGGQRPYYVILSQDQDDFQSKEKDRRACGGLFSSKISQRFAACGEKDKIRFFYRHAREKKHFSAHKCASASECASVRCKIKKGIAFFDYSIHS